MIGTIHTKRQQLEKGYFRVGDGPEKLLIVGSCRAVPYLNYLDIWNKRHGRFTVSFIDPCNFNWDLNDNRVDYEAAINAKETDLAMLELLASTKIYVHEYYANYGMFNSSTDSPKNIYQFGLKPEMNICVPNFNDYFILGQPLEAGLAALEKFYSVCRMSSFPELEEYFKANWRSKRFFWSHNHVAKEFTLFIFKQMDDRFLHLGFDEGFWKEIPQYDMYAAGPVINPTAEDIANYNLRWT